MNSTILGDPDSVKVDITVTTIQPERDFSLCLIQDKPQHTRLRIIAMPRRADGKVYRFSAMEAQEDGGWVSLNTWLGRHVPALTDSFEVCSLACLQIHILLTYSLVFRTATYLRVHPAQASFRFPFLVWLFRYDDVHLCTKRIQQKSCMPSSPLLPHGEFFKGVSPS
jgi:hypothetical protein